MACDVLAATHSRLAAGAAPAEALAAAVQAADGAGLSSFLCFGSSF